MTAARSFGTLSDVPAPTTPQKRRRARPAGHQSKNGGAANLELELITTRAAFDALEHDWNALFARAGLPSQVFQTFNWNWHWANHYLEEATGGVPGLKLSILTGRRDGALVMVWPLVKQRVRGITQLFWMGDPVSQYGDVVIDNLPDVSGVLKAGWAFLKAEAGADVVRLRRVRADSRLAPLMEDTGARIGERQSAPYLDFSKSSSYNDYEQRYSPRSRRNRKRLSRRLEEQGGMEFIRTYGGEQSGRLAVEALDLKAQWLKDRGLVSHAISDPRMRRFFHAACGSLDKPVNCVVAAIQSNGEPAAIEVSFTCKGRLAMHVIVFNLKFEKSGAGTLLLERSMRNSFDEGLTVYDMLAPSDAYKLDWSDETVDVIDWIKPLSLKGFAYARVYLGFLRPQAKAAVTAMPPALRRIMTRTYAWTF